MRALYGAIQARLGASELPSYLGQAPQDAPAAYTLVRASGGLATPGRYGDTAASDLAARPTVLAVSNHPATLLEVVDHIRGALSGWEPPQGWSQLRETDSGPALAERDGEIVRWSVTIAYTTSRRRPT